MTTAPPKLRIVLCRGEYCNMSRRSDALYKVLEPEVARLNAEAGCSCLKLEIANCLSMCALAPNLVLYPEDAVYNKLDEAALRRMIDEKLVPFAKEAKNRQ